MAEFTIPKAQRPALNKLRTISDATLQEFASQLEQRPFTVPEVQGLSSNEASELKDAVAELYRVREYFDTEVPEFAAGIADSLRVVCPFPEEELAAFRQRLVKIMTVPALGVASKSESLKVEYERRFCTARILTDARPVYVQAPPAKPAAMMIAHTFRITFHDDTGELREIYITMDDDDLTTIRELVDRAELKTQSLQSVFEAANIPIVAP